MTCILKSLWPLNANFPPQSRHLLGFSYRCRLAKYNSLIVSNCLDNSCSIASLLCYGHVNCWIPRATRVTAPGYDCKSVSKDVSCRRIKASVTMAPVISNKRGPLPRRLFLLLLPSLNWSRFLQIHEACSLF